MVGCITSHPLISRNSNCNIRDIRSTSIAPTDVCVLGGAGGGGGGTTSAVKILYADYRSRPRCPIITNRVNSLSKLFYVQK